MSCYEQALRLNPDYVDCRVDLATTLLQLGDYKRGWVEFEWRWRESEFARQIDRPLWDGSPLEGRTILLIAEQGLGDTLQFIRYAALVKERGGTVIVACQKALLPLLESCPGIDRLVAAGWDPDRFRRVRSLDEPAADPGHHARDHPRSGPVSARTSGTGRVLAPGAASPGAVPDRCRLAG